MRTNSVEETQKIAADLAQQLKKTGGVVALSGGLGAGKTTFTQGFAKSLQIQDKIISPTFVLIRQHQIPETKTTLFHIDLYRLEGKINIAELGLEEMWESRNMVLIEWAEKIKYQLPESTIWVEIKKISDSQREIKIKGIGDW